MGIFSILKLHEILFFKDTFDFHFESSFLMTFNSNICIVLNTYFEKQL